MRYSTFFGLLLLAACQSPEGKPAGPVTDTTKTTAAVATAPDTTTLGGCWFLQPALSSDTAAGKTPTLILDLAKSKFAGNTGCNTMHGAFWFSQKDSSLSFSDKIILTKMACPGYNEPAFIKSLKNASHYRLNQGILS